MNDQQENQSQPASESVNLRSDDQVEVKRGRGRPKGSKNRTDGTSTVIPDSCSKCQSTEFETLSTPRQMKADIEINGSKYNHITWRRCQCRRCGNVMMRKFYRNI